MLFKQKYVCARVYLRVRERECACVCESLREGECDRMREKKERYVYDTEWQQGCATSLRIYVRETLGTRYVYVHPNEHQIIYTYANEITERKGERKGNNAVNPNLSGFHVYI